MLWRCGGACIPLDRESKCRSTMRGSRTWPLKFKRWKKSIIANLINTMNRSWRWVQTLVQVPIYVSHKSEGSSHERFGAWLLPLKAYQFWQICNRNIEVGMIGTMQECSATTYVDNSHLYAISDWSSRLRERSQWPEFSSWYLILFLENFLHSIIRVSSERRCHWTSVFAGNRKGTI